MHFAPLSLHSRTHHDTNAIFLREAQEGKARHLHERNNSNASA
jgi:hypothetical protein